MRALRSLLVPLAVLGLAAVVQPLFAQEIGVAAAVNQSAQGIRPNAAVRTISLGDNVIYNERIDTNAEGLVQILLADGTTFTVGPNSSLVIDSFVYDPAAGKAQVAATFGKGVLRFIGAATSKTPNGVAITTPVGVVGIRGGVTDINMSPPDGIPPHVSMIFGNSVTLSDGLRTIGRLFEAGYSLAVSAGGGIETVRTPPGWASLIQQALSSAPGKTGGAPQAPGNANVAVVANVNSNQIQPEPPVPMPPLQRPDQLAEQIVTDLPFVPDDYGPDLDTMTGYASGLAVLTGGQMSADPEALVSVSIPGFTDLVSVAFDASGDPVAGTIALVSLECTYECATLLTVSPSGSTLTFDDGQGGFTSFPVEASLVDHTALEPPGTVTYCECEFLRWGFWSASGEVVDPLSTTAYTLSVDNGIWAVGKDFTDVGQLDQLSTVTATYNGHAVGSYHDTSSAMVPTLTAGEMELTWSFGARTGTMEIADFGGRDISGTLLGDPSIAGFIGVLDDGDYAAGIAKGSFLNDGDTIAAGVLGDFAIDDGSWQASGIFMGER